jgi:hypothetical protein
MQGEAMQMLQEYEPQGGFHQPERPPSDRESYLSKEFIEVFACSTGSGCKATAAGKTTTARDILQNTRVQFRRCMGGDCPYGWRQDSTLVWT